MKFKVLEHLYLKKNSLNYRKPSKLHYCVFFFFPTIQPINAPIRVIGITPINPMIIGAKKQPRRVPLPKNDIRLHLPFSETAMLNPHKNNIKTHTITE